MGSRGPLPPKLRAQARLASVRPAQRPPLPATLTGPSHGAPRGPPARPGAAATAAAAIPGPGAAPHPAPPQLGRPEMASSAFRPGRWQMASPRSTREGREATPRSTREGREAAHNPSALGPSAPYGGKTNSSPGDTGSREEGWSGPLALTPP